MSKTIVTSSVDNELLSRRTFLKNFTLLGGGAILAQGELFADSGDVKSLKLKNVHERKLYNAEFFEKNCYKLSGLFEVNKAFIDYRAREITRIDVDLINLLYEINTHVGLDKEFCIVSGYRSKKTNEYLRKHLRGVAKNSYHIQGKAVDIYVPGIKLRTLRDVAMGIGKGGVGYYPRSNFVHVDVGPVRHWRQG